MEIRIAPASDKATIDLIRRPKAAYALGQLDATEPPTPEIADAHARVVRDLGEVIRNFDEAIDEQERGDSAAWTRAVYRLNDSWATSLVSSFDWLMQATGASDETAPRAALK